MDVSGFNKNCLNTLLDKLSKENKQVFLLGDFNINLLSYNDHQPKNEFLGSLASDSFILYILQPTRITSHSKILYMGGQKEEPFRFYIITPLYVMLLR